MKMFTQVERTMHAQSENFIKNISNIKMCQKEIVELKNTTTAMKNSKEGFTNRLDQVEERISKHKGRAEFKADKKKNEDS